MFSTHIIFPKFQHKIKPNLTPNFILPVDFFTDITSDLSFNCMTFLGSIIALIARWVSEMGKFNNKLINQLFYFYFFSQVINGYANGQF